MNLVKKIPVAWLLFKTGRFGACLRGGGGPQVGEEKPLRWSNPRVHIISHFNLITFACWGNPPLLTSPTWGPPPLCKEALNP